jgi:hypothetical protein
MIPRLRFGFHISFVAFSLEVIQSSAQIQNPDPWRPLKFIIGSWIGTGSGMPGEMIQGVSTFSFNLDKNILMRKNRVETGPKAGETVSAIHEDLLIVYPNPGEPVFSAIYFDNEKHVIHYSLNFPKDNMAIFESEISEKAPRFRLIYELSAEDTLKTDFLIAFPGGDFKSYVKGAAYKIK